jgi:protein ImuB
MERMLCVWYPDWPLRRSESPPDEPCQAIDDSNLVIAVNATAAAAGIVHGMRRREAEAVVPTITTVVADPGADMAAFEPVADAAEQVIPRVEIAAPGLLFAPVGGAIRYFGGERPLVERIAKEIDAVTGAGFRIGLAAGPFAAHRAAEQATHDNPICIVDNDATFLASLDVAALGSEDLAATFRWLGITTLGELAQLPRAAVVSRFGNQGMAAHRLAAGEDRDSRPRAITADISVEERFLPPLENMEQAAFVSRALAHRLLTALAAGGTAPHRLVVRAEAADGAVRERTWRNADPFDEVTLGERVRWQLHAWLDSARMGSGPGIRGGLVRLRITPADISDEGRQLALSEDAAVAAETYRALAQAQSIVGPDGVLQARPQGGRDPGEQVDWYRWGEQPKAPQRDPKAPWPGAHPSPAPALVPQQPPVLEVEWDEGLPVRVRLGSRWEPVLSWAGPWRKMGRWWQGEGHADRYQLVTSAGAFLCEVRETGIAYLTGVYD